MGKQIQIEKTISYFIDEEKRTVKAVIRDVKYDAYLALIKIYGGKLNVEEFVPRETLYMNSTYTGTATCHELDEFDIEKGKTIARKHAIAKYNNAKARRLQRFVTAIDKYTDEVKDLLSYTKKKEERTLDQLAILEDK